MEVHNHPHTARKKWYHYFWEFFMLFLAVSLGFIVENLRERIGDTHREKEFAKVLYAELTDDSIVAANKLAIRLDKERDMDYLASYFKDSSFAELPKQFYPAFTTSLYLMNTYTFEPKDGILNQLKNSGSQRYFKSALLQKLLGSINVCINDMRSRNDQEYQFFANPIKSFLLNHYDFTWLDELRKKDNSATSLVLINNYRQSHEKIEKKMLNIPSFDRGEASNIVMFYKQMLISTRTLQLKNYMIANHKVLDELRNRYDLH